MKNTSSTIDLSGSWKFSLGDVANYTDSIRLPGSLQAQGFGEDISVDTKWTGRMIDTSWYTDDKYAPYRKPGNVKVPFWLQPDKHYIGVAWYQRDVEIPQEWEGKRISLTLERAHIQTTVWIDGNEVGSRNTLGAPHVYELGTGLTSGKHVLTIQVDNQLHVDVGPDAHSVSDHTQTNWNGIIGKIELSATSLVWIDEVQAYPHVAERSVKLRVKIGNTSGSIGSGKLIVGNGPEIPVCWGEKEGGAEIVVPLGADAALWDEFTPVLHRLKVRLITDKGEHEKEVTFGLREVGVQGTQFILNGHKIFLRGTLECCVFPKTGYPPTDEKEWKRIFTILKSYGFNHVRFHSWCPPEAAFAVADELGFYLQIECSSWANTTTALGLGHPVDEWLYEEARAIIRAFGNHPSFLLMAYGNEPSGKHAEYLARWNDYWKNEEPRRVHTGGAGWPSIKENGYDNMTEPRIQLWGERLTSRINVLPPATTADYSLFVEETPRPIVSHEIGQWCVYPDFSEIPKYTGLLKAKNFEIFQDSLKANHMADQAADFLHSSGKLQVLCYREDIESAIRTKGFGGFHVLQANDFPGQGTALVGWLNPFWESKGYTTPEEFRRFNNSTVLIARLERRIFSSRETLHAEIEVAHFEAKPLENARPYWKLTDDKGHVHDSGDLPIQTLPVDNGIPLGSITVPLCGLPSPMKYRLVVGLAGTDFENDWEIWLYPAKGTAQKAEGVAVVRDWETLFECTKKKSKVLYIPMAGAFHDNPPFGFSPIFWNSSWTTCQTPRTLGIHCDPEHPIFAGFPTESHTNWQWWELFQGSSTLVFDHLPAEVRPLVQVIDDWFTNRRLGLLFEARIGECEVIVSGVELLGAIPWRHAARQFRKSILDYMTSPAFHPEYEISWTDLARTMGHSNLKNLDSLPIAHERP